MSVKINKVNPIFNGIVLGDYPGVELKIDRARKIKWYEYGGYGISNVSPAEIEKYFTKRQ